MAAYVSPAVPESCRSFLTEPKTLRFLAAFVRRRVPKGSCEDVVQSVLVSALESRPPALTEALPKWLTGIARHKIADFHRRASRERGGLMPEASPWEDPVEARDLVLRARSLVTDPERRTFEWMLRAHEGDALEEIAREEALPAPVVRQRVTRLRRALRGALGIAAAVALVLLLRGPSRETIRPEPEPAVAAVNPVAAMQGRWRVVEVSCGPNASAVVCLMARFAKVDIHGSHATVLVGSVHMEGLLLDKGGVVRATIYGEQGRDVRVRVRGDRLELSDDRGTVTLARE